MVYIEMAHHLRFEENKDDFNIRKLIVQSDLNSFLESGNITQVRILTAGESSCDYCRKLENKKYDIEFVLKKSPIPHNNCNNNYGFCRCIYLPVYKKRIN